MKPKYRVYIIGNVPPNIRETVSGIHAVAILKSRKEEIPVAIQGFSSQTDKPIRRAAGRVSY